VRRRSRKGVRVEKGCSISVWGYSEQTTPSFPRAGQEHQGPLVKAEYSTQFSSRAGEGLTAP